MAVLTGYGASLACTLAAVAVGASGCYAPTTRDCELSCDSDNDCASGQVCGPEHLCAQRSLSCATGLVDGGLVRDSQRATAIDAHEVDAPATVALTIMIGGMGTVTLDGGASCSMPSCQLVAPMNEQATLVATPAPRTMFDMWMTGPCVGQGATCTFVPLADTTLQVHFKPSGM
jgi:hypothetical protein